MRYLLLIYEEPPATPPTPEEWAAMMPEYNAFTAWLNEQGWNKGGEALHDVDSATTVTVRVVRKVGKDTFRVRASSPPLRATRKGWIKAALNLRYRKGDAIAFGVRGDAGPYTVHGGMEDGPNGRGDLKLAKGNSARTIRNAFDPPADGDDSLSSQGISVVLTLSGRAGRRSSGAP